MPRKVKRDSKKKVYKSTETKRVNHKKFKKGTIKESLAEYRVKQSSPLERIIDESWDFRKSNTKEYTHCFHSYPAMMIPQVARRLIENYGSKAKILFDPYCGTGTSLVEANLKGINAIGTDINPLARLIAATKTTKIDVQILDLFLRQFSDYFFNLNFQEEEFNQPEIPHIKNIDFWFSKSVQRKLSLLIRFIKEIKDVPIRNFFNVAFSETVRESSFVKPGEFKLVRRKNYNEISEPDVYSKMIQKLSRNRKGLIDFQNSRINGAKTLVLDFNTVDSIPERILPKNSVDLVVTSPPYGDSRTTVAYGQFSRLSNEWLGITNASSIDNSLMGGVRRRHQHQFNSPVLNEAVFKIQKLDKERARDVISFYEDYEKSINNIAHTLKKGAYVCYVVGNRTVKGIKIPTDEITVQLFEKNDFKHCETIVRNIPNKRMPLRNSPSNIIGVTASTMKNEFIVICQKS